MRITTDSRWDVEVINHNFIREIVKLDIAHKRAKRELSKQQKVIARKNEFIKCYKEMYDSLVKQYSRLNRTLEVFQDNRITQIEQDIRRVNDISNLELKIACLEQENKTLRKQQTSQEKEVQERIIQSMNDIIVELRAHLNETEEKYNELLKRCINEE